MAYDRDHREPRVNADNPFAELLCLHDFWGYVMASSSSSANEFDSGTDAHLSAMVSRSSGSVGLSPGVRSANGAPMPFAWQHGTRLILLDEAEDGWVMAELQFEPELCRYVDFRRAVYPLTREAIGAVLSRALASGDHAAVDTAFSLNDWLTAYYGISIIGDVISSPNAGSLEFTV